MEHKAVLGAQSVLFMAYAGRWQMHFTAEIERQEIENFSIPHKPHCATPNGVDISAVLD